MGHSVPLSLMPNDPLAELFLQIVHILRGNGWVLHRRRAGSALLDTLPHVETLWWMQTGRPDILVIASASEHSRETLRTASLRLHRWWRSRVLRNTCWVNVEADPSSGSACAAQRPCSPKTCPDTPRVPPVTVSPRPLILSNPNTKLYQCVLYVTLWYRAQGDLGSARKVSWHFCLPSEALPYFVPTGTRTSNPLLPSPVPYRLASNSEQCEQWTLNLFKVDLLTHSSAQCFFDLVKLPFPHQPFPGLDYPLHLLRHIFWMFH